MTPVRFVDVEAGGRKRDFERQVRFPGGAAGCVGPGQRAPRPLALIDLLGVAVEAHLDRSYRKTGEAARDFAVEALAIGFDLELHAALPERLGQGKEVRDDQRLAAAEHHVGDVAGDDVAGQAPIASSTVELVPAASCLARTPCSSAGSKGRSRA